MVLWYDFGANKLFVLPFAQLFNKEVSNQKSTTYKLGKEENIGSQIS